MDVERENNMTEFIWKMMMMNKNEINHRSIFDLGTSTLSTAPTTKKLPQQQQEEK